jgi:SAM-dependent methyltransferase
MPKNNRRFRTNITQLIHVDRFLIRKKIRKMQTQVSGVLLDVGCGKQPYQEEFKHVKKYIGLDRTNADIIHDLAVFPYPLKEASADWILCTQVLDDLPDQGAFVRELHRLLVAQGGLILSVSFVWELHDLPHDYGRPSPEQLRLLLEQNGFEIVELQPVGNSWTTLGQVININLLNIVSKRSWWFKLISPLLLVNSLFYYAVGSLFRNEQSERLPLAFFVVARKK